MARRNVKNESLCGVNTPMLPAPYPAGKRSPFRDTGLRRRGDYTSLLEGRSGEGCTSVRSRSHPATRRGNASWKHCGMIQESARRKIAGEPKKLLSAMLREALLRYLE